VERIFAKQKCVSAPPSFHPTPLLKVLLINYMIMDFKKLKKKKRRVCCFFHPFFFITRSQEKKELFVISEEIFTSVVDVAFYLMVIIFI
jgi:hypothetical protein